MDNMQLPRDRKVALEFNITDPKFVDRNENEHKEKQGYILIIYLT